MQDIGVIHGRFQPLHKGHMEYLLAGKSRCKFLYVGITNPDPRLTEDNQANINRSLESSNPFTYYERLLMITESLIEAGVPHSDFAVIPFPINVPELIKYYAPREALYFATIYDEWGKEKISILRSLGLDVDVMWERSNETRVASGTEIRKLMKNGGRWESLVPNAAVAVINKHNLRLHIAGL